jgi:hypothetical protein
VPWVGRCVDPTANPGRVQKLNTDHPASVTKLTELSRIIEVQLRVQN